MKKIYYLFLAAFIVPALTFAQVPDNSICQDAVVQTLEVDGPTVSVTGSGTNAVDSLGINFPHVWEAFTISECATVTIDLCGTTVSAPSYFVQIMDECPPGETTSFINATAIDTTTCGDIVNPALTFTNLAPGTYYYPLISLTESPLDDYTMNFMATAGCFETDTCLNYVDGPWNNFNTMFGGAPVADANGVCPVNQITAFEVLPNESYIIDGFVAGEVYTFSVCDGPGAGLWSPTLGVINATDGTVVAYADGCSITWTCPMDGSYIIGITETGMCYNPPNQGVEGGYPTITCEGTSTGLTEADKASFSVYPNPSNGQFTIGNVEVSGNYTIEVIDLAGRVIHSQVSALSTNTETKINLNEVAAGVYMVKMINTSDNTEAVQRIVIK